jgi:hypothetical protein
MSVTEVTWEEHRLVVRFDESPRARWRRRLSGVFGLISLATVPLLGVAAWSLGDWAVVLLIFLPGVLWAASRAVPMVTGLMMHQPHGLQMTPRELIIDWGPGASRHVFELARVKASIVVGSFPAISISCGRQVHRLAWNGSNIGVVTDLVDAINKGAESHRQIVAQESAAQSEAHGQLVHLVGAATERADS